MIFVFVSVEKENPTKKKKLEISLKKLIEAIKIELTYAGTVSRRMRRSWLYSFDR